MNIDVCIPTRRGVDPDIIDLLREDTAGSIHISKRKPLVLARKELIAKVKTDLFLFLDDDVLYTKGLLGRLNEAFTKIRSLYVKKLSLKLPALPTGAVQGSTVSYGLSKKWDRWFYLNRLVITNVILGRCMMSNTLIRTDLVKDWLPATDISGAEDWSLTNHIKAKGYNCYRIPTNTLHKLSWRKVRDNAKWNGSAYRKLKGRFPVMYFLDRFGAIIKYVATLPLHPRLSYYTIYQNYHTLKGVLIG